MARSHDVIRGSLPKQFATAVILIALLVFGDAGAFPVSRRKNNSSPVGGNSTEEFTRRCPGYDILRPIGYPELNCYPSQGKMICYCSESPEGAPLFHLMSGRNGSQLQRVRGAYAEVTCRTNPSLTKHHLEPYLACQPIARTDTAPTCVLSWENLPYIVRQMNPSSVMFSEEINSSFAVGSRVDVGCSAGYELFNGDASLRCHEDGTWQLEGSQYPRCLGCPVDREHLDEANLSVVNDVGYVVPAGSSVALRCPRGLHLIGHKRMHCFTRPENISESGPEVSLDAFFTSQPKCSPIYCDRHQIEAQGLRVARSKSHMARPVPRTFSYNQTLFVRCANGQNDTPQADAASRNSFGRQRRRIWNVQVRCTQSRFSPSTSTRGIFVRADADPNSVEENDLSAIFSFDLGCSVSA